MAPGTKRIAFGGAALALLAWAAISAWLPEDAPLPPPPRDAAGLAPIPEVATVAPSAALGPREALASVLAGCFRGTTAAGATLVERYRVAADGAIEGELAETAADGTPLFEERLRIAAVDGRWRYLMADGATALELVAHDADRLRFADDAHDPPRSIEYRRRGAELTTRVEGMEEGRAEPEVYATRAERCP